VAHGAPEGEATAGPASKAAPGAASATLYDPGIAPSMAKASQATMFGFASPSSDVAPASVARPSGPPIVPMPSIDAGAPATNTSTPPIASTPPVQAMSPVVSSLPTPSHAASHGGSNKQTMIGVAAVSLPAAKPEPTPSSPAPKPGYMASGKGTMLGVAIPGIAPTQASAPLAQPGGGGGRSNTMLGVAIPGIAPIHGATAQGNPGASQGSVQSGRTRAIPPAARPAPAILPKPAPLVDDEPAIGPAPRAQRRGVPLAYVAGGVFVLVLIFGGVMALLWKGQSLIVTPRLDAQGHEQLHLACDSCEDGTTATLDDAHTTFAAKEADLLLATPLKVGDNPLTIRLDRPRWGRDEEVKVVVPIAFRIKADLSALSGPHPSVVVRVQAAPGTVVRVDDKPVTLDAHGDGAYSIDVSAQTTGWSDDLRLIDPSIPYSITSAAHDGHEGSEQHGTLAVRAGVATLHLDAPGVSAVVDTGSFRVAGHTVKGGTVTINGQPVTVDADGSFARSYDAPALGELPVEVRADGPQLASRVARFTVKRVAHLAAEAKSRERAPWIGYDGITSAKDSTGKLTVVEGEVAQALAARNQTVAIIDDTRDCKESPCLVRVVYAGNETLATGDHVRVYGRVNGVLPANASSAAGAKPVPVVDADFLVKGHAGR
jgi:hypothetical protein